MQLIEQAPVTVRQVRVPLAIGVGVLVVAVALLVVPWWTAGPGHRAVPRRAAFPSRVGGWSATASSVRRAPLGAAVALADYGDGRWLAVGADGTSYRTMPDARAFTGRTDGTGLLSPDGRTVAIGGTDDLVRLVRLGDGSEHTYRIPHAHRVRVLAYAPDGRRLVCAVDGAGGTPDSVILLDPVRGTSLALVTGTGRAATFSPDGGSIAVQIGPDVQIVHRTGKMAGRVPDIGGTLAGPHAWSPDGRWLALTDRTGRGVHFASTDPGSGDTPPAALRDRRARFVGWADPQTVFEQASGALLRQPITGTGHARRVATVPSGAVLDDVATGLLTSPRLGIARGDADYGPPASWWLRTVIGIVAVVLAVLVAGGWALVRRRRASEV